MKAFLFFLLSICFINGSIAQEEYKKTVDSLLLEINKPQQDTAKISSYYAISKAYLAFDTNASNVYCEKLLTLSKRTNNLKGLGNYYLLKTKILTIEGKIEKALLYVEKAIEICKKTKFKKGYFSALYSKAFCLAQLNKFAASEQVLTFAIKEMIQIKYSKKSDFYFLSGCLYSRENKYHLALLNFKTAISEYRKSKKNGGVVLCYLEMCTIYSKTNQLPIGMKYIDMCIQQLSLNKTIPKQTEAIFYVKKGEFLNKMNNYSEALPLLEKGLKINLEIGNKSFIANNYYQFAETYYGLKNYKKAIAICKDGLKYNDETATIDLNYMLGKTYFKLGSLATAKAFQLKALNLINTKEYFQNEVSKSFIYESLADIEYRLGNYKMAYSYNNYHTEFEKQLLIYERESKVSELLTQFDVNEKDIANKNLTIANQKRAIELQQQNNFIRIISYGMIASILLLTVLLISFQINRKKKLLLAKQNQIIADKNISLELSQKLLQKSLTEKEVLLKEIHHRVKNNLQLVMSLLNIQARQNECVPLKQVGCNFVDDFIEKGQSRISAMALIHQNLYQTDNFDRIDFQEYIENLIENIKNSFHDKENIHFEIQSKDIFFDIETATPLGLILNELISNALKHAFPNNSSGTISISLINVGSNIEITFSDDGIGIKNNLNAKKTLGLELVQLLVNQIKGTLNQEDSKGTCYKIVFKS